MKGIVQIDASHVLEAIVLSSISKFTFQVSRLAEEAASGSSAAIYRTSFLKILDRKEVGDIPIMTKLARMNICFRQLSASRAGTANGQKCSLSFSALRVDRGKQPHPQHRTLDIAACFFKEIRLLYFILRQCTCDVVIQALYPLTIAAKGKSFSPTQNYSVNIL